MVRRQCRWHTHPVNGPFSRTTKVSRFQKGKPIWILLKQETVSGSGISWAICKSVPRSIQITTPAPHHSVFLQAGCPSCRPTNSIKALKAVQKAVHCWQNSSVFSLTWMCWLPSQQGHAGSKTLHQQNPPALNWSCRLTQADLYNCHVMVVVCLQCSDAAGWAVGRASGL